MTAKNQKARKGLTITRAKQQLADLRREAREKDEKLVEMQALLGQQSELLGNDADEVEESPLGSRWEPVLGDVGPGEVIYFLDGNDEEEAQGTISRIEQGEDQFLFHAVVGVKQGYFLDIEDAGEQGERWLDGPAYVAKNNPVEIRPSMESNEQQVGQDRPRDMKTTGPARDSLAPLFMEPVREQSPEKMEELAFMEEEVNVLVHDTTDDQAVPIPCFQNDGITQYFIRGAEQTAKRKFVEILGRCKLTKYTQEAYKDASGADAFRQIPHTALMYPFVVINDHNKGRTWLSGILAEG
jgi:hypothetical protein